VKPSCIELIAVREGNGLQIYASTASERSNLAAEAAIHGA